VNTGSAPPPLAPDQIEDAARRLFEAERDKKQIHLLSLDFPDATMDDAYAVQAALVKRKQAAGLKRIGWKIGLTSKAMQSALAIDIPDSGILFDDMVFPDGGTVPAGRFIQPRIEAEIAFVMKAPLAGAKLSVDDVLDATDHVTPSLEILDTRIERMNRETGKIRTFFDTISDNAANAGLVLGGKKLGPREADLRWMGAIVSRNGEVEETGLGAGVLDHPARGIAWLAERLNAYGMAIGAGDIVLSGSFIRPVECRPGDAIAADFGPHGTVGVNFAR
jgi:2-oxo-hept-3-ene-1,7-dioate hydratase